MISKISFLIAFVFIFYAGIAQDNSQKFALFEQHSFQDENDTLLYRLLTPDSLDAGKGYPLVVFFHGEAERGYDNTKSLDHVVPLFIDNENNRKRQAFVLVPQCPENSSWTYPGWYREPKQPMRSVIKLIDQFIDKAEIDTARIYLTGYSMGGYATWYLLTRFPGRFAAAIPIAAGGDPNRVSTFAHVPVWAFHGRKDNEVSVEQSRNMIRALKKTGARPRYTEYKRVKHNSWERAYKEEGLLDWLFSQRL